jgi:hypothetical protein
MILESSKRWCISCRTECMCTRRGDSWSCEKCGVSWPFAFDGMLRNAVLTIAKDAVAAHACEEGYCCGSEITAKIRVGLNKFLDEAA